MTVFIPSDTLGYNSKILSDVNWICRKVLNKAYSHFSLTPIYWLRNQAKFIGGMGPVQMEIVS